MKILVLNGSPKGKWSVTLQTTRFLKLTYPEHEWEVLNVGAQIKALEKDFSRAKEALENAELIVFSYPVYTFIAPYQLHRFIELVKLNKVSVSGKIATQISTSKHFYDVTAHRYIEDNCADLGLNYVRGLSADMDDLLTTKGQGEAKAFFERVLWSIEQGVYEKPSVQNLPFTPVKATFPEACTLEARPGDVVVITDATEKDENLNNMILRLRVNCKKAVRVVNISEYPFKGGCLGCFNCAVSGKCIYKDGFDEFLRNTIQKADAIVIAFSIKDHSMGTTFKLYDDRQFCNGHRTVTMGMPMGYLVSGNLQNEENLKTIIEARAQVGGNFLAGVATDEVNPDKEIDDLCRSLEHALDTKYCPPQNFYGIGGMKIFRDLIYQMQGLMKADHKFYKAHGQYDFPQKKKGRMIAMYFVGWLLSSEKIKSKMGNAMNEGMLMPYEKLFKKLEKTK